MGGNTVWEISKLSTLHSIAKYGTFFIKWANFISRLNFFIMGLSKAKPKLQLGFYAI